MDCVRLACTGRTVEQQSFLSRKSMRLDTLANPNERRDISFEEFESFFRKNDIFAFDFAQPVDFYDSSEEEKMLFLFQRDYSATVCPSRIHASFELAKE